MASEGSQPSGIAQPVPAADQQQQQQLLPEHKKYRRIELPTPESMAQEEFMNNCATRTVLAGAMGSVLGVMFGLFMGTMDTGMAGVS